MPELDSIRGIAVLLVVFYHGFFWSNVISGLIGLPRFFVYVTRFGWLGVQVFFVLSGFLITGILEDSKYSPRYFLRFYWRRALRILPVFYATLLILALVPSQSKLYLLLSFFYLSNIAPLLHIRNTYAMFWSLAAEEHFYLIWPFLVYRLPRRALLLVAFVLFAASPLVRAFWFQQPLPEGFSGFTWLIADGFAAGAFLALVIRDQWCTRRRLAMLSISVGLGAVLLLLLGAPFGILSRQNFSGAVFMLTAAHLLFAGLLGLTLLAGTSAWKPLVNHRLLSFYGEISYGLYLIHWAIFVAYDFLAAHFAPRLGQFVGDINVATLRFVIVLAAATLLAWISRRFFEERFLQLKSLIS